MDIFEIISYPAIIILKPFLQLCYDMTGNYAIAIVVFTVILNIVLFPLSIKQQKSMAQQAKLKPKIDALREKYGKDRMKIQQETQALYQKEGVSQMAGCLVMLPRLIILIGVMIIIRQLISGLQADSEGVKMTQEINKAFNLMGIDLSYQPTFDPNITNPDFFKNWAMPLFSFGGAFLSSIATMKQQKNTQAQTMGGGGSTMMLLMPFMSLVFAFSFVNALSFYWGISSIIGMIIQMIVMHYYSPEIIAARESMEIIKEQRQKEEKIKIKA